MCVCVCWWVKSRDRAKSSSVDQCPGPHLTSQQSNPVKHAHCHRTPPPLPLLLILLQALCEPSDNARCKTLMRIKVLITPALCFSSSLIQKCISFCNWFVSAQLQKPKEVVYNCNHQLEVDDKAEELEDALFQTRHYSKSLLFSRKS